MPSKRHASLFALLAVLLFLGAISGPARAQVTLAGIQTTVPVSGLNSPYGVAVDAAGDLFIADAGNNRVVEVPAGGGAQITVPVSGLNVPIGVAVDGAGDLFIADAGNSRVVELPAGGGAQTTVGSGLSNPFGVAVDTAGDVFITDSNNNRVVEVPAGGGAQTTVANGLGYPIAVAVDGAGDLFVTLGYSDLLVEIPYLGNGMYGDPDTVSSGLSGAQGVAVDGAGDVFIADAQNSRVVEVPYLGNRRYGPQITVSSGLRSPEGVAVDGAGDIFITDYNLVEIQRVAGNMAINFGSVNVCPEGQTTPAPCSQTLPLIYNIAASTTIFATQVVTEGAPGLDFITSDNNCVGNYNAASTCIVNVTFAPLAPGVRMGAVQLTANFLPVTNMIYGVGEAPAIAFAPSVQSTVAANGLSTPRGVAVDGAGDVFIADTGNNWVLKVQADGTQTTLGAGVNSPTGVAVDGAGNVFIADTGNSRVVEVPAYCIYCLNPVPVSGLNSPAGVAVDGAGDVFIADTGNNRVVEVPADGGAQITVSSGLSSPNGVAVDGTGDIFIADTGNNRVVEVPVGGGAQITVGSGLSSPIGVAVDAAGDVYIADSGNKRLVVVPYLGNGVYGIQTAVGGGLTAPIGVAVDGAGNVIVGDSGGKRVVKLLRSQPPTLNFASTPVGSTSSDSPQVVTVQNIGNQPLSGYPPLLLAGGNFVEVVNTGSQVSCIPGFQLTPGASCLLSISFEPQTTGNLTAPLRFADNTLNLSALNATQNVTLQGTGLPSVQETATALWSSQNPSISGQAVTFTATIYPQVGGEVTGTVTFKNGNAALATVAVSGNAASLITSALTVGVHSITAIYNGNANFTGSTSATLSQLVQNTAVIYTATALTPSVNPSTQGKPVSFTATVFPPGEGGIPTGKVTFYNGSTALATVSLNSGTAKYSTSALPAGSNSITAVYGGDTNYSGSTSAAVNQFVIAKTTVTLTSSPNPSVYGQTVYLVAAVSSSIDAPPDGETVTFKHGAAVLGTASLSSGAAIFTTSTLKVGTDAITAVYGGDSNFAAGTSAVAKQVVSKAASTTTPGSSLNPSNVGQAVTFTATVAPQFSGTPTGTVTFKNGTTTLGTAALSGGMAKYTTTKLAAGTWPITAVYNGSTSFASSTSTVLSQVVN